MATQSDIQPDIKMETIRPLIENFFTRTTSEEWDLLKLGKPDNITKVLLAELFLDILDTVSTALLKTQEDSFSTITQEDVRNRLGDTIRASFAPGGKLESVNLANLTDLVVQEVTDTVNSSVGNRPIDVSPQELLLTRVTDPGKLGQMIAIITKMFKAFATKIKRLSGGKLREPRNRMSTSQEQNPAESNVRVSSRLSSVCSDECKSVEEVIVKEVTDITQPIFDEVLDIENIKQNSSVEIINAAEEIIKPAIEESIQIVTGESNIPNSKEREIPNKSKTRKRRKIKNLFAKTFATAWIFRILTQVKTCCKKKPKVKSRQSINQLMGDIYSLLQTEMGMTAEEETCVFEKVNIIPPERALVFTKGIAGLLYMYATNQKMDSDSKSPLVVPESGTEMYSDILKKVSYFLSIMSWFVNNQVDSHTKTVMAAGRSSPVTPEIPQVSDPKKKEKNKNKNKKRRTNKLSDTQKHIYVRILVNQIVTKTHTKTKVALTSENVVKTIENLFNSTWAELKDTDLDPITKNIKNLYTVIFKDLCKKWSCPELLLVAMRMEEPEVGKCIATSLIRQLSKNTIHRSFFN